VGGDDGEGGAAVIGGSVQRSPQRLLLAVAAEHNFEAACRRWRFGDGREEMSLVVRARTLFAQLDAQWLKHNTWNTSNARALAPLIACSQAHEV